MGEFKRRKKYHINEENSNRYLRKEYDYREIALTKMGKRQLMLTLISILAVTIIAIGSSFAIFTTSVKSSDYNVIKVGSLNIDFGNDANNTLSLANQYPISDSEGQASDPYTFTITNTGTLAADYIVKLVDDTDMINQDNCSGNQLDKNDIKYSLDGGSPSLLGSVAASEYIIARGSLEPEASKTYNLRVWIKENVSNDVLGKHFHGQIVVEAVNSQGDPVADVLLKGVGENGAINTSDPDQTFITGTDPNNYIWYSGKLWRAVSIDPSDNSVKLVTQWNISAIPYNPSNQTAFEGSYMEEWLNDTSVDGFLGNLRDYENFIKTDSVWNATVTTATTKPVETTMVTAPVGLLNIYEYTMSYSGTTYGNGYLNNGLYWWTLTPHSTSYVRYVSNTGDAYYTGPSIEHGVRPSINLKSSVKITSGDGSENNPYRLAGDNDSNISGTLLNTRYSGEYITFGTGENTLYRIVSHETNGLTKITSAEPLKNSGNFIESEFGDTVTFSSNNTIGAFLNGDYLTSYVGNDYVNMIEDSTTWYLGKVGDGVSYRLAKYKDATGTTLTSSTTTAKVGLLRLGELMAGQFDRYDNNTTYWMLTPYSTSHVRRVNDTGDASNYNSPSRANGVRPAMNLKSSVTITGGSGTKSDPFTLTVGS